MIEDRSRDYMNARHVAKVWNLISMFSLIINYEYVALSGVPCPILERPPTRSQRPWILVPVLGQWLSDLRQVT